MMSVNLQLKEVFDIAVLFQYGKSLDSRFDWTDLVDQLSDSLQLVYGRRPSRA